MQVNTKCSFEMMIIYYERKAVQSCLALREKLIAPSCYN